MVTVSSIPRGTTVVNILSPRRHENQKAFSSVHKANCKHANHKRLNLHIPTCHTGLKSAPYYQQAKLQEILSSPFKLLAAGI